MAQDDPTKKLGKQSGSSHTKQLKKSPRKKTKEDSKSSSSKSKGDKIKTREKKNKDHEKLEEVEELGEKELEEEVTEKVTKEIKIETSVITPVKEGKKQEQAETAKVEEKITAIGEKDLSKKESLPENMKGLEEKEKEKEMEEKKEKKKEEKIEEKKEEETKKEERVFTDTKTEKEVKKEPNEKEKKDDKGKAEDRKEKEEEKKEKEVVAKEKEIVTKEKKIVTKEDINKKKETSTETMKKATTETVQKEDGSVQVLNDEAIESNLKEEEKTEKNLKKHSDIQENKSFVVKRIEENVKELKTKDIPKTPLPSIKAKSPPAIKASKKEIEQSKENIEQSKENVEHIKENVVHIKENVEYIKENVEHTKEKIDDILNLKETYKTDIKKTLFDKDKIFKKTNMKIKNDNKPVNPNIILNSQEKDVFEYVPDTSSYNICHNEPNELYKDVVSMNKHFLNEMSTDIYASPLNTYLSNVLNDAPSMSYLKSKKISTDAASYMRNKKGSIINDKMDKSIDETANEPKCAYEYFKDKVFKCYDNGVTIEINPSQLKYNDSTEYEYNQNLHTHKTDPLAYLNKLKCEIEDITQYITNLVKTEEPSTLPPGEHTPSTTKISNEKEKIIKQILHNREVPELLLELHSLEKDVDNILSDEQITQVFLNEQKKKSDVKETNNVSEEMNVQNLLKIIDNLKENKLENGETPYKLKNGAKLVNSFNIYTMIKEKEAQKEIQEHDLLQLEKKVADLEKFLGIEKMPLLPYDDINQAILDLYSKLSLLDPNKLENVKKKVQTLQSEFANLKKSKRDILNLAKDRSNYEESIDELFKMLEIWKKTHHILPNILTRLHQLKTVHDNAQSFSSRLNDIEEQQGKLSDTLNVAKMNIETLSDKIDENVTFLQEIWKKIENKDRTITKV